MKLLKALTALTLATSFGTLVALLVGMHKMRTEVDALKTKSAKATLQLRAALNDLDI